MLNSYNFKLPKDSKINSNILNNSRILYQNIPDNISKPKIQYFLKNIRFVWKKNFKKYIIFHDYTILLMINIVDIDKCIITYIKLTKKIKHKEVFELNFNDDLLNNINIKPFLKLFEIK